MKLTPEKTPLINVWTGKTLSAILLMWLLSIAIQAFVSVRFFGDPSLQTGLSSFIFSATFILLALWLARRGRPKTGVLIVVVIGAIASTITMIWRGGLNSPVAQGYIIMVLLIGFVVGRRSGFVTAVLVAVIYTVMFWAEGKGVVSSLTTIEFERSYLFLITRLIIITTFTYFAAQAIENAFTDLSKSNVDLQQSHAINVQIRQQLEQSNMALEAANAELQVSEARYRTIVRALGDAYFIIMPPDARFVDMNDVACTMLGYTRDELLGTKVSDIIIPSPLGFSFLSLYTLLQNQADVLWSVRFTPKSGDDFPVEIRANPIQLNGKWAIFAIARDVSDREEALAKIEASLEEKEVLLREIHHRVKNNLQVVSSMMRTSSRKFHDEPLIQSELKDLSSRVLSMATIHQQLYQSGDFAQIEFAAYTRKLVMEIGRTHIDKSADIRLEFDLQPIHISLETAVPAGMIINELVINAIKHGYPPERNVGVIHCKLHADKDEEDVVNLTIENDGLPFDENDVRNEHTMGMQLVNRLVHQIDGELTTQIENGVSRFMLSFRPREERIPK